MWRYQQQTVRELFRSLDRKNKEAFLLLGLGTFLEYFDLLLFVHMAVVLDQIFFPQSDPRVGALLGALAFCSSYTFRPIGALIFGHIGDRWGRRYVLTITTFISGIVCLIMVLLPSGKNISSFWIIIGCRAIQSMASTGEVMGARIYLTEITPRPVRYPLVSLIDLFVELGGVAALAMSYLVIHTAMSWRIAFALGAIAAIVGSFVRLRLGETKEFLDIREQQELRQQAIRERREELRKQALFKEEGPIKSQNAAEHKIPWKSCFAYFGVCCPGPLIFFFVFVYFVPTLKGLGYTASDIVTHNFWLSITTIFSCPLWVYLCVRIFPMKITKMRGQVCTSLLLIWLVLYPNIPSIWGIAGLQVALQLFVMCPYPAGAVFLKAFPPGMRFRSTALAFALSRAGMNIICSFGALYITELLGTRGLLLIVIPMATAFFWGLKHFNERHTKRVHP